MANIPLVPRRLSAPEIASGHPLSVPYYTSATNAMMPVCRFRTTEMSQAMDTGPPGASQAWPPWTSRGAGTGSLGASSSKGSLKNLTPPAAVPSASPPLNRSLLRNKYAGSADSTASDGGKFTGSSFSLNLD